MRTPTAAVVAVGDELLLGDTINTNAAWLGNRLAAAGVPVVSSFMVGDDVALLAQALRRGLEDADVVLVTGGLGPTTDDLTREAVAVVADAPLERIAAREEDLRRRFAEYGIVMPEEVLRQADVPHGAVVLENSAGTAPGLRLEVGGKLLFALPGPPHELQAVIGPVFAEITALAGAPVVTRSVHTSGLGESAVAEIVRATVQVPDGVALAYLAGRGIVRVRFTGTDDDVLTRLADEVAAALGDNVWGRDGIGLDEVVHAGLAARSATVAVAESLTGGLLGAALTAMPGSSGTFRGSLVVYATDLKETLAGVLGPLLASAGAVSAETAAALAAGARDRLSATYGIGVTGVAGPEEQEGQPVGTVHLAVAGPDGSAVRSARLPGDRERIRLWAVNASLDLLRRELDRR